MKAPTTSSRVLEILPIGSVREGVDYFLSLLKRCNSRHGIESTQAPLFQIPESLLKSTSINLYFFFSDYEEFSVTILRGIYSLGQANGKFLIRGIIFTNKSYTMTLVRVHAKYFLYKQSKVEQYESWNEVLLAIIESELVPLCILYSRSSEGFKLSNLEDFSIYQKLFEGAKRRSLLVEKEKIKQELPNTSVEALIAPAFATHIPSKKINLTPIAGRKDIRRRPGSGEPVRAYGIKRQDETSGSLTTPNTSPEVKPMISQYEDEKGSDSVAESKSIHGGYNISHAPSNNVFPNYIPGSNSGINPPCYDKATPNEPNKVPVSTVPSIQTLKCPCCSRQISLDINSCQCGVRQYTVKPEDNAKLIRPKTSGSPCGYEACKNLEDNKEIKMKNERIDVQKRNHCLQCIMPSEKKLCDNCRKKHYWECTHCTFINHEGNVCHQCSKTDMQRPRNRTTFPSMKRNG